MKKIKVSFVGGVRPHGTKEIWGGSAATFNAFEKAFENDKEFDVNFKTRLDFPDGVDLLSFLNEGDISHVDDTGIIQAMFNQGLNAPDVIGPIVRSPIKEYKDWKPLYTKDWFYKAKIIRLNYNEERKNHELVDLIRHGIDTKTIKPKEGKKRKYVLWAGMIQRYAKNYELMEEIMNITNLPEGYEFKVLNRYNVEDYWEVLDETVILINTSRYESFCCALFEARAKGVATIQPLKLNGVGVHEDAPIQVEYTAEAYKEKILELIKDEEYTKIGKECREYCEETASLKVMRDDVAKYYKQILKEKI